MAATVKIRLREPQEFYVPGDTIMGRVVLTSASQSYVFTELSVELWCVEYYNTSHLGKYSHCLLTEPAKENYTALLEQYDTNGCTELEFGFTIVLDSIATPLDPPSFSIAASNSGVAWKVVAKAHLEKRGSTLNPHNVLDSHLIEFHPDAIIHPAIHNLTALCRRTVDLCDLEMGNYLSQRPAKFTMRLRFNIPRGVHCRLKLCLQKKIVIIGRFKSEVIREGITLASRVKISEASEPMELSCQLEKREPCAFSSRIFILQYTVSIELTGDFTWYKETFVDLVPPSPESRLSRKQLPLAEEEAQIEPPPMYSE